MRARLPYTVLVIIVEAAILDGFMCVKNENSKLDFEFRHYGLHIGVLAYDEFQNAYKYFCFLYM